MARHFFCPHACALPAPRKCFKAVVARGDGVERNRLHHLGWLGGIEVFEARFDTHRFPRHAHEGFAIGAILDGVGGYTCRGERKVLPPGRLSLMNPEEPHTGEALDGSLRYVMVYADEPAVRRTLDLRSLPGFAEVTPADDGRVLGRALTRLAARLGTAHTPRTDAQADPLAIEEAVQAVLSLAFALHGRARLRPPGREPSAVRRVRAAIEAHAPGDPPLSLASLAGLVSLHPNYLMRVFTRTCGLSPYAWHIRHRVQRAKAAMLDGAPIAEAAQMAGFCDQAHLTRQFRRQYGATPGRLVAHGPRIGVDRDRSCKAGGG